MSGWNHQFPFVDTNAVVFIVGEYFVGFRKNIRMELEFSREKNVIIRRVISVMKSIFYVFLNIIVG